MPWDEVDRWTKACTKCGGTREIALVQHNLGSRLETITRWCACPMTGLFLIHPFPLPDPEVDPDGSEGGTV